MDIDTLLKALEKDENEAIIDMTSSKIHNHNKSVLAELHISEHEYNEILKKLDGYKYIDDISNINLKKGAIVCDIKFTDTGISVICKGYHHRHFHLDFDECLIFQRLTDQEMVLLSALDYLSK